MKERIIMVEINHNKLTIKDQCRILGLSRSSYYYQPKQESSVNLELMRLIDEHYLNHPEKGSMGMYIYLTKDLGYRINHKRIERLYYKMMGLQALVPGPHTSKKCQDHPIYPYLLRGLKIEKVNQVWAMDITYVPMHKGFMYLVAIIDLFSRYVLNWSLSSSMETSWCRQTLEEAIAQHGAPEILNTDQGSQFTSPLFTETVLKTSKLSMDGKGRAIDNIFIERLWRTVKYEHIYLNPATDGLQLWKGLDHYFEYYNRYRRHSSIGYQRPIEIFMSHAA